MVPLGSQLVGSDGQILVVHLPGRVTDDRVAQIRDEVRARLPRVSNAGLVLDFAAVELINSIGITCLLEIDEQARNHGVALVLAALPPAISKFFIQLKLQKRFTLAATLDDAIAKLDPTP